VTDHQAMFANMKASALPWTAVRHTTSHVVFIYAFLSADKQLTVCRRRHIENFQSQFRRSGVGLAIARRWPRGHCRIATHGHRWRRYAPV